MTEKLGNDKIEQEIDEFFGLIDKIDRKNVDKADIQRAQELVRKYPEISSCTLGMAGIILKQFLDKLNPQKSQQLFFEAETLNLKKELGYATSNQIEKLLIDQILLCWAGVNYTERRVSRMLTEGNYTYESGRYWQETLTRYQNRYLRAIETLARVRKLNKSIAVQFNIATDGGQQVNVNEVNK
jgi:hypothetical protein